MLRAVNQYLRTHYFSDERVFVHPRAGKTRPQLYYTLLNEIDLFAYG